MINNAPLSQIHLIQQMHSKHKRRLQKIVQSRPRSHQYTLSNNFLQMLQTRRFNHERWRQFNRNKQRQQLSDKNQKMFNKLVGITSEDSPYSQLKISHQTLYKKSEESFENSNRSSQIITDVINSQVSQNSNRFRSTTLHHNYQIQNLRRIKAIDQQNPKLAQRIIKKSGFMSHLKDEQEFRKTREVMKRLRKFQQIKRAINQTKIIQRRGSSQVKIRSKTLPTGSQIIKQEKQMSKIHENEQNNKNSYKCNNLEQLKAKIHKQYNDARIQDRSKRYRTIQSIRQQTQGSEQLNKTRNGFTIKNSKLKSKNKEAENKQQSQLLQSYLNSEKNEDVQ